MELRTHIVCSAMMICAMMSSARSQFYSDYSDGGGGSYLQPYDIPVVYKEQNYPAAYPVAPTIYAVTLMKPIEAMPGKKTVPLYIVPEDSIQVDQGNRIRTKRSHSHDGLRVNIKYPEYIGLTDGYHIPAVEIPLNKPMIVRQIEANVLAPSGFMVPYQGDNGDWPYPMSTGCLVGTIPRNTYVSEENPITIRKLYAVPNLPEYPTYRPVPQNRHGHSHLHIHGLPDDPAVPVNDALANYFSNRAHPHPHHHHHAHGHPVAPVPHHQHLYVKPKSPQPVFELVPVTQKSRRRNDKRRNKKKNDSSSEEDEEEEEDEEDDSDEQERTKKRSRNRDRKKSRTTTTTTTAGTTTTPTTTTTSTTTTARTTTPAASSIQDIIAAFSSYRNRGDETTRPSRLSASFRDDRDEGTDRYREDEKTDRNREEGGRGFSKNSEEPSSASSSSDIKELRQQMLTRQINQLQKLLTSLNLSSDTRSKK